MKTLPILLLAGILAAPHASAASIRDLLEEAFDSPSGNVFAPVDGEMTDHVKRTVPIKGDIMAEVKTIKHFQEKDCRRFQVTLKAMFAPESGHKGQVPLPSIEMNYCKGGHYPAEGVDPGAGKRFTEQMDAIARERAQTGATPPAVNPGAKVAPAGMKPPANGGKN